VRKSGRIRAYWDRL